MALFQQKSCAKGYDMIISQDLYLPTEAAISGHSHL